MRIYIVRHGQTLHNKKSCYYGDLDFGLTDLGERQAISIGSMLKEVNFDKVYVSERKRAYNTAELITNNNSFIIDPRLNERSFGEFEGLTYKEIEERYPREHKLWIEDWLNFAPKNGESYITMSNRVFRFMDELLNEDEVENILLVTHSGVMRALYCYVMNKNIDLFWKFSCENGDLSILKYEYGNLFIESIEHCRL